jgi:hypothetical protein
MLLLQIEGQPLVQAVRLDDPSPGYAARYARSVCRYLKYDAVLLWCEVDVSSVSEYGPNDIAAMLSEDTQDKAGLLTDLPQRWERLTWSDV